MAEASIPRDYVLEQTFELLEELGVALGADCRRDAHSLLDVIHREVRDPSVPADLRELLRAEAKLISGRVDAAREAFDAVAATSATTPGVRGVALDRQGDLRWWAADYREAAELYRRSLALRPDDARTRADLARALYHAGEDDAGVRDTFGEDVASRVERQPAKPSREAPPDGVCEVNGLYVGPAGSGVMVLQGCREPEPGMVATGCLGSIAQEACDLTWSIWRREVADTTGVRIHATQAAVPKDGPSLGLAVWVLFGEVLGRLRPQHGDAFTGELDLRGRVLPVGGVRDKALAAYLLGLRRVFVPAHNRNEVEEGFQDLLEVCPVTHVDEVAEALS